MKLKTGCDQEYKNRHDEIWPEVLSLIEYSGVMEYYIFLDEETHHLFAFQKRKNGSIAHNPTTDPIMQRWWDHMADIMEVNPDNSPVVVPCQEMFKL
ncbi:L-rhamnose mutarotase [Persicitalea jodogahamensis]|uniref:L-rhamnose mutarotase n=2 Tax=Persicitalea jodogahamensis TaxID=402147 RepID=A0A8J3D4X4_9BACT|nr:L-rhamnose mutarotase [Persicitalea jodogahamensis]GHB74947.1 L-rhamnose mutarotase [Persicitalea jodogahamensis]